MTEVTGPERPPAPVRHARAAVAACFFVNAVLYANMVPRLPAIKDQLDLTNASLGAAIAAMPAGALVAGLSAPWLIQRVGSARTASFGLVALAVAVAGVPHAGAWPALAAVMLVIGGLDSVVDVAQNAHGFRVQRRYGRSIVNAFHGFWSVGAVTGGLLGAAAAGLDVPVTVHLAASAAVFSAVALASRRHLLPGPEDAEREVVAPEAAPAAPHAASPVLASGTLGSAPGGGPGAPDDAQGADWEDAGAPAAPAVADRLRAAPRRSLLVLAALGVLAACGAFVEDAGGSWGALYLRTELGAGAATAGLAFVSLQLAMTLGRLSGDRVVDRFGQRAVARAGGALVAVGMGAALALPSVASTLAGFALAGLGVATLVPAAMHAADELPGLPRGVGLTVVSWLLRVGFLVSPPLVGVVADATSLRVALLSAVVAGVGIVTFGRVLAARTRPRAAVSS